MTAVGPARPCAPSVPSVVLTTKLLAPALRSQVVARARLRERLDTTFEPGHRLTLVSAPAGFGKSTVLSDWVGHLPQRAVPVRAAWLSLDDGDNDLGRLVQHLLAALSGVGVDLDEAAVLESLPADHGAAMTSVVNAVAGAAARSPDLRWVLVLDDYHVITAPEAHDAVSFLLEHLPDQLRLVLATRADPPLALPRLRSRGQLVDVRGTDLRFTRDEARQFLNEVMHLDLDTAAVEALDGRTEGWIAGLQLAALSLRAIPSGPGVADFIEAFAGSDRFVIDYLTDEVLARQPAGVREFLLRTSILERLTGPLCDAVSGQAGGAATLAALERDNLFLVPLDTERSWYRYHHLFADVLLARLSHEDPDLVRRLHRRASDWYAERGLVADAVRHALVGEDVTRAAYLMEEALPALRRAREDQLMLAWIRALPPTVVRHSPVLSIWAGWARMLTGDLAGLEAHLDDADAALEAGRVDVDLAGTWAQTEDLRTAAATILVYRASLAQARGDVAGTVLHARGALDLAGPEDHVVRGSAGGFLGLATWAAGDVEDALTTFSQAVRSLHAAGSLVDGLDATVNLADMWVAAGRPRRARRLYEQALVTATGGGEPYPRATADLHVGLAELDLENDDLAAAEEHLETARVLAERTSITENRHRWPVAMAGVRAARGDLEAARGLLEEARGLYRRGFYPDLRPIGAMEARLGIAAGDLEAPAAWAREHGPSVAGSPDYLDEYEHLTLVRLRLAQHRVGGRADRGVTTPVLTGVLGHLGRLQDAAVGRDGSLLEIGVLQALTHHAGGDGDMARRTLGAVLDATPEPESHARLFLDEGAPMQDLLRGCAQADPQDALRGWARRLLDHARRGSGTGHGQPVDPLVATVVDALADPLSRREVEVLRLLGSELSGPQIAGELYVSLNTLRTHTKRIFTKLDVTSRAAAVRAARERGLL